MKFTRMRLVSQGHLVHSFSPTVLLNLNENKRIIKESSGLFERDLFAFLLSKSTRLSASKLPQSLSSAASQGRATHKRLCGPSFFISAELFPLHTIFLSASQNIEFLSLSPLCFGHALSPPPPLSSRPQELLMVKLRGSADSSGRPAPSANFVPRSKNLVDAVDFNPLLQFDHIGQRKLDQVCSVSLQLNCGNLCLLPR